jgi:para-nitrobenzyl esterase
VASSDTVDAWPRYDAETRATLILDRQSRIEHDPLAAQRHAWDGIPLH